MTSEEVKQSVETVKKPKYTATEKVIAEMLKENTGSHFLDSGGAYGRNWERNQKIGSFKELPEVKMTVWKDKEIELSISTFHYLSAYLELDKEARKLQKQFDRFAARPENESAGWFELTRKFAEEKLVPLEDVEVYGSTNTYNYDNLVDHTLQYLEFEKDGENYIILQIHGGCDVRGGYTAPKIFRIRDSDYFHLAQTDVNLGCKCTDLHSDDSGYHWYVGIAPEKTELDKIFGTNIQDEIKENGLPSYWKFSPIAEDSKDWQHKITCQACKHVVTAQANLDF